MKISPDRFHTRVSLEKIRIYTEGLIFQQEVKDKKNKTEVTQNPMGKTVYVYLGNLWGTFILILEVEGKC